MFEELLVELILHFFIRQINQQLFQVVGIAIATTITITTALAGRVVIKVLESKQVQYIDGEKLFGSLGSSSTTTSFAVGMDG